MWIRVTYYFETKWLYCETKQLYFATCILKLDSCILKLQHGFQTDILKLHHAFETCMVRLLQFVFRQIGGPHSTRMVLPFYLSQDFTSRLTVTRKQRRISAWHCGSSQSDPTLSHPTPPHPSVEARSLIRRYHTPPQVAQYDQIVLQY